jgi:hypothetical protein
MSITRVMAFTKEKDAAGMIGYYMADGYKVIRIDKPDIIELMKPGSDSHYWYSSDEGTNIDYILVIATKDTISIA